MRSPSVAHAIHESLQNGHEFARRFVIALATVLVVFQFSHGRLKFGDCRPNPARCPSSGSAIAMFFLGPHFSIVIQPARATACSRPAGQHDHPATTIHCLLQRATR
jgi:hypothetical protein